MCLTFTTLVSIESHWKHYLSQIATSVASYQGCQGERCGCHGAVIDADLAVWKERGGIRWEEFLEAKKAQIRGVHYQIINHTLFREEQCLFSAR